MRDAIGEKRISFGGLGVHMGVKRVPREMRKCFDIINRDFAFWGDQLFAQSELMITAAEGVIRCRSRRCIWHIALHDFGQDVRRALNGSALHIGHDTAHTAQFLAPACAAWTPVHQMRHGRSVACAFLGRGCVVEIKTSVIGGRAQNHVPCKPSVRGKDRGHQ